MYKVKKRLHLEHVIEDYVWIVFQYFKGQVLSYFCQWYSLITCGLRYESCNPGDKVLRKQMLL
jgi:hypothetical protein